MVINFGLRYDSFDANTTYPSQRRNPINSSTYYLQNSSVMILWIVKVIWLLIKLG